MQQGLHRLPGRATSALLAVVAAAAALAIAIPVAHGHLDPAPALPSWCDAQSTDGGVASGSEPCSLCLATGHAPAATAIAAGLPARAAADRLALPRSTSLLAATPRGPAGPRAPPALG